MQDRRLMIIRANDYTRGRACANYLDVIIGEKEGNNSPRGGDAIERRLKSQCTRMRKSTRDAPTGKKQTAGNG